MIFNCFAARSLTLRNPLLHKLGVEVYRKLTWLQVVQDQEEANQAEKRYQLRQMQRRNNRRSKVLKAVVSSGREFTNFLPYEMYFIDDRIVVYYL